MAKKPRAYTGEDITVTYEAGRCIHVAECLRALPQVFDTGKRPWINPAEGQADAIAEAVMRCPSGALQFERHDDGASEEAESENSIMTATNGGYFLRGNLTVKDAAGETIAAGTRLTLCRCGASKNKPFCDNSHREAAFKASGRPMKEGVIKKELSGESTLTITAQENGSLRVEGDMQIKTRNGDPYFTGSKTYLCRCGGSSSKPFCDGTHKKIGFEG